MNNKIKIIIGTFTLYYQKSTLFFFSSRLLGRIFWVMALFPFIQEFCSKGAANKSGARRETPEKRSKLPPCPLFLVCLQGLTLLGSDAQLHIWIFVGKYTPGETHKHTPANVELGEHCWNKLGFFLWIWLQIITFMEKKIFLPIVKNATYQILITNEMRIHI